MSKASHGKPKKSGLTGGRRPASDARAGKDKTERVIEFGPPLKPRRGLLIALSVLFALWFAFLLGLYFKTVYPERHPATTKPAAAAAARRVDLSVGLSLLQAARQQGESAGEDLGDAVAGGAGSGVGERGSIRGHIREAHEDARRPKLGNRVE